MEQQELQRGLKSRHVQLIAIGGTIGTGLFLGSGKAIALAGPSILFAYLIVGIAIFFVMRALGELLLSHSGYSSFTDFAAEYIGEWAGFITGWTYWFCWIMIAMADVIAVGMYVQYWYDIPQWVPAVICLIVLLCLNLVTVKLFGELEFWFALIKIITIVGFIILGVILVIIGFETETGKAAVSNIWSHGGMFPNGIHGFLMAFQMVVFAFLGVELIGMTAAETEDPDKNIPSAINKIPLRIILFYVGAILVILMVIPWNQLMANESPFVKVFALIGIPIAAGIVNFVVLTSAASSGNSGLFSTSRMLYSLGQNKQAPKAFARLNKRSIPRNGLLISTIVVSLAGIISKVIPDTAFSVVTAVSSICFLWIWGVIVISHLRYRKTKPELHKASKFKAPLAPAMNYVLIAFFIFLLVLMFISNETRTAVIFTPIWFILLAVIYKVKKK